MSTEQTRGTLKQLNKEIATLEKRSADFGKKEATARSSATRIVKSIPKNASPATINSKQAQITRQNDVADKARNDKANVDIKIADKRRRLGEIHVKLQKEETAERKKYDKAQLDLQRDYEHQIKELTRRIQVQATAHTQSHHYAETGSEEYDVFVSYASEDKEAFVNEFVGELKSRGIKAWHDESQIAWGDSMREKIDHGLSKSRFGVVVISRNYIAKGKYWTKAGLNGLFQSESVNREKILPIWHDITKNEVIDYSPLIAEKLAMNTASMTPKDIADKLAELLKPLESDGTGV